MYFYLDRTNCRMGEILEISRDARFREKLGLSETKGADVET